MEKIQILCLLFIRILFLFLAFYQILKRKPFKSGWLDSKIGSVDFVKVEGILKDYILKTAPDNRYKNPKKLFDGIVGDINFRDGDWNGFIRTQDYKAGVNERNSGDLVLEIDLKGKVTHRNWHTCFRIYRFIYYVP